MKVRKLILSLILAVVISAGCCACSSNSSVRKDDGKKIGYQLEAPAEGEEIAVLTTSMGTIKIRLFPEAAPKAVENFKGLIRKGYYNGVTFHRVIEDFMIQTGDPTGTGAGGESIWQEPFEDEFNSNLLNLRGAVAMANSGKNTNGSQFFINQASADTFGGWEQYEQAYSYMKQSKMTVDSFVTQYGSTWLDMDKVTDEYREIYEKNGGNPYLDGYYNIAGKGHTVFGQVFEGMDTVDKIAAVRVDAQNKPVKEVIINKATIEKYKK